MDIVINSNIQSPLIRTLSATQGKSESFTHHIKDNVPPVSFSKIELNPDGGAAGTYNRNYKFKIPQYGYLRNLVIKFQGSDNPIGQQIMMDIQRSFLPPGQAGSGSAFSGPTYGSAALTDTQVVYSGTQSATTIYDLRNLFGDQRTQTGSAVYTNFPAFYNWVPNGFVPPTDANVRAGGLDPWESMFIRVNGGYNYASTIGSAQPKLGDARILPFRSVVRYDASSALGRNMNAIGTGATLNNSGYCDGAITSTDISASWVFDWSKVLPMDGGDWHLVPTIATVACSLAPDPSTSQGDSSGNFSIVNNSATMLRGRYLGQRLNNTYDWCSQSNLSKYLGALMPQYVQLSTHNRVIQTIQPFETVARIFRMPQDQKRRYLSMIRPHVTSSPSSIGSTNTFNRSVAAAYATNRTWTCYFPCFFSFFEDPSMNLDTRFVENLEVDVFVQPPTSIFDPMDLGLNIGNLGVPYRFNSGANNRKCLVSYDGFRSSEFRQRVPVVNTGVYNVTTGASSGGGTTAGGSANPLTVTALAFYHNFHDSTSQNIRDSNFKPDVPANVLGYNTYVENPVQLTAQQICQGGTINVNLACNNLISEIVFMVRRRQKNIASNPIQATQAFESFLTTLPIKSVTLTGSGQQIYSGTGAECLLVDQWDYPLSSVETGTYNTNDSGVYADSHESAFVQSKTRNDGFFGYRIGLGFSADRTYNSGAIALQTINNPVLSISLFDLHGWVIQDDNLAAERPSVFNLSENLAMNEGLQTVLDYDYEIDVYCNYWQLIRIDSNTGSITKSLDL